MGYNVFHEDVVVWSLRRDAAPSAPPAPASGNQRVPRWTIHGADAWMFQHLPAAPSEPPVPGTGNQRVPRWSIYGVDAWVFQHLPATAADTGATAITLSGPSSGIAGNASTNFTVGADGDITGTITVTPTSSAGTGTFTPPSVQISAGTPTATFTYTPSSVGARNINCTNDGGLSSPSNVAYTASAATISLSGPSSGARAQASTAFTVSLNAPAIADVVVTPTDSSGQGSFTPSTVTILAGQTSASSTFTYTPTTSGARNINCTNDQGLTAPANHAYNATAVPECIVTGTIFGARKSDIVAGGKTSIFTLIDCTYVAAGATFDGQRQNAIDGCTSNGTELTGWNNEVRDNENVTSVVRTSATVMTITWSAAPAYDQRRGERVTPTLPSGILSTGVALVAHPAWGIGLGKNGMSPRVKSRRKSV